MFLLEDFIFSIIRNRKLIKTQIIIKAFVQCSNIYKYFQYPIRDLTMAYRKIVPYWKSTSLRKVCVKPQPKPSNNLSLCKLHNHKRRTRDMFASNAQHTSEMLQIVYKHMYATKSLYVLNK